MPSFLNKVFGYKKHDNGNTLLDGKYEAISPSAASFAESDGFSLFKPKSRPHKQTTVVVPHLTLQLPGPKDSRALGAVFDADPDSLPDAVIAAERLDHSEALLLIRACTQAITERGLETLGIMHPHWFSASPDVQRKLISLFIRSLPRISTLSSPTSAFEKELHYTRSPHDIAAVLRWALRHLSLENGHFGKLGADWAWYTTFFHAERSASYPPRAFSELLLPHLPPSHIELLTVTLDLISALASHAETNSISGSKLSKFLGIWLLVATRAEESDDWNRFYARWERAGRILEHLFLVRLREESFSLRLPTRLQELIKYYPYNKGAPPTDDELLSRPRFSTRQYDALCVRVESTLTHDASRPKRHPIQLLLDAFQLPIENPSGNEHIALWNTLKTTISEEATSSGPQFDRIFVDETIQLLSLISTDSNGPSPTLLTSPIAKVVSRKRSSSFSKVLERALSKLPASDGSTPISPTSPSSAVITDWAQFSLSGFGGAPSTQPLVPILSQDDDIEVTQPRMSRKSSRRRGKSRSRRRRSEEREPLDAVPSSHSEAELSILETKVASVHMVQIDEAFIDFWSDAIADPISANWPTFVLCGLKESTEKPPRWLLIEQAYSRQQPPRNPSPDGRRGRSPRPSFKSDISGFRINSVFSSTRKRLSLFSKSATDLDPKKSGGKTPIAGELGEVLVEEEPTFPSASPPKLDLRIDGSISVEATVTSGTTADKLNEIFSAPDAPANQLSAVKVKCIALDPRVLPLISTKARSVEPAPQSGNRCNGTFQLPGSSVEPGSPQGLGSVSPRADNAADPLTTIIAPVATDLANSRTSDPMVIASGPTMQNPGRNEEVVLQTVPMPADGGQRLPVEPSGDLSSLVQVDNTSDAREIVSTVAMSASIPIDVAEPIVQSVTVIAPELAAEEPHTRMQPSRNAPANVAMSATESVDQHETDHLAPLSATEDEVIGTEAQAQPEPNSAVSMADGVQEEVQGIPELAEIPTPAPEHVVLVQETPPGVYVDAYGRTRASQVPVAEPNVFQDTAHPVNAALQATLGRALPVHVSPIEIIPAPCVPAETELAADQESGCAMEEAHLCEAAEALHADVSAGIVSAAQASLVIQAAMAAPEGFVSEAHVLETRDICAPTPAQQNATLVDETPGREIATEECEPVEASPATITPESEAPENKGAVTAIPESEALTPIIPLAQEAQQPELPTQALAEPLPSTSHTEGATAALTTTVQEMTAVKVEARQTLDSPAERRPAAPECASVDDTLEISVAHVGAAIDPERVAGGGAAVCIIDEARVLGDLGAAAASIGSTEVSSAPAAQFADQAVSCAVVGGLDHDARAVADADGPVVAPPPIAKESQAADTSLVDIPRDV